jgi:hypothetical protein
MTQVLIRFLVGGAVVSAFALTGDVLKPKSFGGLFGAAPSVALATLGLTVASNGAWYASTEARSMIAGAIAFVVYASIVARVLMRYRLKTLWATLGAMPIWFVVAFGIFFIGLRS